MHINIDHIDSNANVRSTYTELHLAVQLAI